MVITTEEIYIKCSQCGTELKVYDDNYYKGHLTKDLELVNNYVFCSIDCMKKFEEDN
jgi:hypothetical protein